MNYFFRFSWLLLIALILPINLPAGGPIDLTRLEISRRKDSDPLIVGSSCFLRVNPSTDSVVLRKLMHGTPIRFIRSWPSSSNGTFWVQVNIETLNLFSKTNQASRGWIRINDFERVS